MRELLAYSQWAVIEEKLTLRIRADNNGDIYLPTAWYSSDGTQDCAYDWMVGIDGNNAVEYNGIWSSNWKIRVGYGLSPLSVHTVIIKPKEEDYSWLRAFWYKGTDIASSLINIISDKSYKGYALSELFTGDYYKAYQYYWCSNLINTDEELLPDTLEVIGNNYRYYEYAGCSSLVNNAEEKILKTVKVIWDNYRAYQYENCVWINKINMRAINWASVGNNYRYNQFSWMGSDRKPMDVYIEGGIEEGGDWWLVNSKVKGVYVYQGLVSDYQTKLSTITSSKIKKNADWDNFEYEFIEYIGIADSTGKIRIPVGWFSTSFTQDCNYDWMVSVDGGEAEEITGTGWQTYVSVGSGLTEGSEHRVVIKPKTISWGWGRAFGFHTTWAQDYIKEIIHDSYKCFAVSRISTGDHYKHWIFTGCTNLINSYEKLPTSVTTIGMDYMSECYGGCTSLKNAFWEVLHKGISIWNNYRYHEYIGCSAMEIHEWIAWYSGIYPTNYKNGYLSGAWNNLEVYITRYEALASGLTNSMWLADNKVKYMYCFVDDIAKYIRGTNWTTIWANRSKRQAYYYGYVCKSYDVNRYTKLLWTKNVITPSIAEWWNSGFDVSDNTYMYTMNGHSYSATRAPFIMNWNITGTEVNLGYTSLYDYDVYWSNQGVRLIDSGHLVLALNRDDYHSYAYWGLRIYTISNWTWFSLSWNINPSLSEYHNQVWYGVSVSRNGQYIFCNVEGQIDEVYMPTKFSFSGAEQTAHSWISGEFLFSDDWMTMYYDGKEYSLSSPRYIDSRVYTGRTYPGGIMKDWFRYVFNWSSISKYAYE